MLKRFAALLVCLALLPCAALAEVGEGVDFRLSFGMNPEAYPENVQSIVPGIADLLDVTTIEGRLLNPEGDFDLQASLTIGESGRGRIDFHIFHYYWFWYVRSPLLGDTVVDVDLKELLPFAMKANAHLGIPLQRAAILVSPFVHAYGVEEITEAASAVLFAKKGSRTIAYNDVAKLAARLSEIADDDQSFRAWAQSLAYETGYDETLTYALYAMPEWVESHVPKRGIDVKVSGDEEVWTAGSLTLLRRKTDRSGAQSLSVYLPELDGYLDLTLEAALQPDGDLIHGSIDLAVTEYGEEALRLHADGSLPVALPVTRPFSLTWEAEGPAVGDEGVHLYFEGEPTGDGVALRQMTPDHSAVMLTVNASLQQVTAEYEPGSTDGVIGLLSVNSDSLHELMERIAMPMARGVLPLVAQAPASFCQTMMNLLEDSGVFALLTDGLGESDEWDSEW